jgi:hypothetical protein
MPAKSRIPFDIWILVDFDEKYSHTSFSTEDTFVISTIIKGSFLAEHILNVLWRIKQLDPIISPLQLSTIIAGD